jgi:hypothetical protein
METERAGSHLANSRKGEENEEEEEEAGELSPSLEGGWWRKTNSPGEHAGNIFK